MLERHNSILRHGTILINRDPRLKARHFLHLHRLLHLHLRVLPRTKPRCNPTTTKSILPSTNTLTSLLPITTILNHRMHGMLKLSLLAGRHTILVHQHRMGLRQHMMALWCRLSSQVICHGVSREKQIPSQLSITTSDPRIISRIRRYLVLADHQIGSFGSRKCLQNQHRQVHTILRRQTL